MSEPEQEKRKIRGIDYTGKVFGRLTVVEHAGNSKHQENKWRCLCECGNETVVLGSSLRKGSTKSCGCLMRELGAKRQHKHGQYGTRIYSSWAAMLQRCANENHPDYDDYGGRGIWFDARWVEFEAFYKDMGDRPEGTSIDRIDCNGPYIKDNCRWATDDEQVMNRRCTVFVKFNGVTKTLRDWCNELELSYLTALSRHQRKKSPEEILAPDHSGWQYWTFKGKRQSVSEWAKEVGIPSNRLHARRELGWSVEKSLTTPIIKERTRDEGGCFSPHGDVQSGTSTSQVDPLLQLSSVRSE